MRCNMLIMVEEECLEWLSGYRLSAVGVSKLVWKQVPDSGSGRLRISDCRMCYVDGVVWSAINDVRNSRWWLVMSETGMQQSTRYCDALLWRHRWTATPSLYQTGSAISSSRHVKSVTVHGRTCACHWQHVQRRSAPIEVCQSRTSVSWWVPCCSSQLELSQKRGQVSSQTHHPVMVELIKVGVARRNVKHTCWEHVCPGLGWPRKPTLSTTHLAMHGTETV